MHWKSVIAAPLIFVIALIIVMVIHSLSDQAIVFEDPYYNDTLGNHSVFYRKQWRGLPPTYPPISIKHPIDLVIVSCSFKKFCKTSKSCAKSVRKLQKRHQSSEYNFFDIGYNFMIGRQGSIYVGTGWDYRNFFGKISISIAFLGNFVFDELTEEMEDAFFDLIEQGLKLKKLSEDFILIGENQTYPDTLSPGENVYKLMKSWDHFDNRTL